MSQPPPCAGSRREATDPRFLLLLTALLVGCGDGSAAPETRRPAPRLLPAYLSEGSHRGFASLTAIQAPAYGVKAANLGELFRMLPPANRVPGFAIPFVAHDVMMEVCRLRPRIDDLLNDARRVTDAGWRRAALAELRMVAEACRPHATFVALPADAAEEALGASWLELPLWFRPSSNLEDADPVSELGLHGSARGWFGDDYDEDNLGPSRCLSVAERAHLEAELARRMPSWR